MDKKEYRKPYDVQYAAEYNSIWGESELWAPEAKHHIDMLKELLAPGAKWLDAGCGTGFLLNKFPGVARAGFDFSENMLVHAKAANPDALFFKQASLVDEIKEFNNQWDLVSCTGQPWTYIATMPEIAEAVKNLSGYVNETGKCMLTMVDINDFSNNEWQSFYRERDIPDDIPYFNGSIWNLRENGVSHDNMLLPNLDQWVRWFSLYFTKVEIVRWPHDPPMLRIPRRTILCSGKRAAGDLSETTIIEHPIPGQQEKKFRMTDLPVSYFIDRFKPFSLNFWKKSIKLLLKR